MSKHQLAIMQLLMKVGRVSFDAMLQWDQRSLVGLWRRKLILVGAGDWIVLSQEGYAFMDAEIKRRNGRGINGAVLRAVSERRSRRRRQRQRRCDVQVRTPMAIQGKGVYQ